MYDSLYGNYRTRKFIEIFNSAEIFLDSYHEAEIPNKITDESATTLFYLLYARYGNNPIASSDETQFKYQVFSIVFTHGPTWERELKLQDELRAMSIEELQIGSKTIYNKAYNPGTAPSTDTLDEIETINEQTAQKHKRSKLDAYAMLEALLKTDVTTRFVDRFKVLFLQIVQPERPLWYVTDDDNEEDVTL